MSPQRQANSHGRLALIVCTAVLVSGTFGTPVLAQESGPVVTDASYTGQGRIPNSGPGLHVWQSASHQFSVTVETGGSSTEGKLCLVSPGGDNATELGCRSVSLQPDAVRTVSVSASDLPKNGTSPKSLAVVLTESDGGGVLTRATVRVTVFRRDGDPDADGLANSEEVAAMTNLTDPDTDGDGLEDALETRTYGTSPLEVDSDADGLTDGTEVRSLQTDPTEADTDGDGLTDGDEVNVYGTDPNRRDTDADQLPDGDEITTYQTNATLSDTDGDGLGDGAELERIGSDPTVADTDGDGLGDGEEWTIFGTDPTEADTDGDGLDDRAEVRVHRTDPTVADTDGDGLDDRAEVRTYGTNPNNPDTDSDGLEDGREVRGTSDPTEPTAEDGPTGPLGTLFAAAGRRPVVVGGLAVLLAAVVVGYRAGLASWIAPTSESATSDGGDQADGADGGSAGEADRAGAGDAADVGDGDSGATGADLSLMTNEERVTHLLEANGGRMLQSDMVDAAGWSKATVSRVLSEMEANDEVSRVDLGKGNLVTLPDEEPEDAGSSIRDG